MNTKLKWILSILSILAVAIIYYVFFYNPRYFSYRSCDHEKDFFPDYIKEAKWNGENLKIESIVEENCSIRKLTGNYEVVGDSIILNVRVKYWPILAMCNCDYENEFNLKGLSKKDYKIILKVGEKIKDQLTLKTNGEIIDFCTQDKNYQCYATNLRALQNPQATKSVESSKIKSQKDFLYDSEENKKIAENNPDFLRLFKKYEHYIYDSENYDTIWLSFDKEYKSIHLRAGRKGESGGMETGLISGVNSFAEGIEQYVDEKKSMESPSSLEAQLRTRLGFDIVRTHENETSFDFIYKGENVIYCGPFAGHDPKGSLKFTERKGSKNFIFLSGFPNVSLLDRAKLIELTDTADEIYQLIKNNADINVDSVFIVFVQPTTFRARFSAKTDPEKEHNLRFMTIHNFEIPIKDPIEKRYELNIKSGEFKVLTESENFDEF